MFGLFRSDMVEDARSNDGESVNSSNPREKDLRRGIERGLVNDDELLSDCYIINGRLPGRFSSALFSSFSPCLSLRYSSPVVLLFINKER